MSIVNTIRYGDEEFWPKKAESEPPVWLVKMKKASQEEKLVKQLKKQEELEFYKKKYPEHFND